VGQGHGLLWLPLNKIERMSFPYHPVPRMVFGTPCLVTQAIQKWLEPAPKLAFPIRRRAHMVSPPKPTTHESLKN
jgi:hypothetical protein